MTPRVVLLCDREETLAGVDARVRAALPGAVVDSLPPDVVLRSIVADCLVLDARVGGRSGAEALRSLRAGGFMGGVVLLAEAGSEVEGRTAARRFGAEGPVTRDDPAVGEAVGRAVGDARTLAASGEAGRETARLRQLVAAGELALGLQHTLNNSLTALLAEAQLLEIDLTDADHRMAAGRIVELCRRTIGVSRDLDEVAPTI